LSVARLLVDVHLVSTTMMAGLIWFVQIVHYPLFRKVGAGGFTRYAREHATRTTWVVAPLMLVELSSAVGVATLSHGTGTFVPAIAGLLLLAVAWASTAFVQVPCHGRLASAYDPLMIGRLVFSNWLRTIAWSGRVPIALLLSHGAASS
jgi:hypothetical protein